MLSPPSIIQYHLSPKWSGAKLVGVIGSISLFFGMAFFVDFGPNKNIINDFRKVAGSAGNHVGAQIIENFKKEQRKLDQVSDNASS